MPLFDSQARSYHGPAEHQESAYTFYARSALPTIDRIRGKLEAWFQVYPSHHQGKLRTQFEVDFQAGFTELLVHEILRRFYSEVEVDPQVGTEAVRTPDFRVTAPDGQRIYVEATVVTEESEEERGVERALAPFYDIINQMDIPDYFVGIHDVELPRGRTPSARRFKRWLAAWISSVDYQAMVRVAEEVCSFDQLSREFVDDECHLTVSLLPVPPEKRGSSRHRLIGVYPGASRWGDSSHAIAKKITEKGRRYPDLDGPLVVAVNVTSKWMAGEQDVLRALFGSEYEEIVVAKIPDIDRVWCGPGGETYSRISAVGFGTWQASNLASTEMTIALNPWDDQTHRIGALLRLPRFVVRNRALVKEPGMGLSELLDIAVGWPGRLYDP